MKLSAIHVTTLKTQLEIVEAGLQFFSSPSKENRKVPEQETIWKKKQEYLQI